MKLLSLKKMAVLGTLRNYDPDGLLENRFRAFGLKMQLGKR